MSGVSDCCAQVGLAEWIEHPLLMLEVRGSNLAPSDTDLIPLLYRDAKWLTQRGAASRIYSDILEDRGWVKQKKSDCCPFVVLELFSNSPKKPDLSSTP